MRTATEPRRLEILEMIWERELSVGEIADRLPVTIAAVSQHLAKLRAAGLVTVRRDGRVRWYRARRGDLGTLAIVLETFWSEKMDALTSYASRVEQSTNHPRRSE